jgi:hypothetical protein
VKIKKFEWKWIIMIIMIFIVIFCVVDIFKWEGRPAVSVIIVSTFSSSLMARLFDAKKAI